jgi:cell division protein FtsW
MLLLFGLTMLYSTSYAVYGEEKMLRQMVWTVIGTAGALIAGALDYRRLIRYGWPLLGIAALALLYLAVANVLHHLGGTARDIAGALPFVSGLHVGSARWLGISFVRIQPSEFAKVAIILFLAYYFGRHARHLGTFYQGFFKPMAAVGVVGMLILLGGDLSTTAITGGMVGILAFVAGVRLRYLLLIALAGMTLGVAAIRISPERMARITSYRNPEAHQQDEGYQLWFSQLALGSGGWRGLGFTNSRMKHRYLPEAHTDFIVAIIGEELGFFGVAAVLVLYIFLTLSTLWIGILALDREGLLLCCGVALSFGLHAFVNIGVVSGFLPTTGVTAPLISYGGSSVVGALLEVGLVMSVSRVGARGSTDALPR